MSAHYEQLVEGCFAEAIGSQGLKRQEFDEILAESQPILDGLRGYRDESKLAFLRLAEAREDLAALEETAQRLRARFDHLVVFGTGGSSLAGRTLVALKTGGLASPQSGPAVHFAENVDPQSFEELLGSLDMEHAAFIAISKSGTTPETLTQTLLCLDVLRGRFSAQALAERFLVITEPKDNPLGRLARRFGFEIHAHDPEIGGRFSAFSPVGLLPAMFVGFDAVGFRTGGASVLDAMLTTDEARPCPPATGAALAVGLMRRRGVTINVLMPYADRLAPFGLWFRQLWAESLGKEGLGLTPIRALGTVDQHSQLQLYLDGPRDKLFSLVVLETQGQGSPIDASMAGELGLNYLAHRTMGDLMVAEARATAETLTERRRPCRIFRLRTLDERSLGALMMHFLLETLIAAGLIGVDPFDQPAVDRGKELAREYLLTMGRG